MSVNQKISLFSCFKLIFLVFKPLYQFVNKFQALPKNGYSEMVKKMLEHENIEVFLKTPFQKGMETSFYHTFLSIPIDEYYNFKYKRWW